MISLYLMKVGNNLMFSNTTSQYAYEKYHTHAYSHQKVCLNNYQPNNTATSGTEGSYAEGNVSGVHMYSVHASLYRKRLQTLLPSVSKYISVQYILIPCSTRQKVDGKVVT